MMGLSFTEDSSAPVVRDLRIVLLGKTGSGKSETGNTILGWEAFRAEVSPSSVTKSCKKETNHVNDRSVSVVDTPGLFDTSYMEDTLKKEIENCITLSVPGPHIFLLVIRVDVRFTEEEKKAIKWIKENFGEEAANYTMVLFTKGDTLNKMSIENFLDQSPELRELISDCRGGYIVFDNTCKNNRTQVADLFEKIDEVVHLNGNHYTSKAYEEAQNKMYRSKLWSKCGGTAITASSYLIVGAAAAAVPAARALPVSRAALAAATVAAAAIPSLLARAGGGVANFIGGWMNPKPKE